MDRPNRGDRVKTRVAIALPGLAALVWGVILALQFAFHSWPDGRSAIAYFLGGAIGHDLIIAPVVGVVGLLISTRVPVAWRTPLRVGAAISAVLGLIAIPALWRARAGQANPGLDDRNYAVGLLVALAVVWVLTLAGGLVRRHRVHKALRPQNTAQH
jgi:hypothetical protein